MVGSGCPGVLMAVELVVAELVCLELTKVPVDPPEKAAMQTELRLIRQMAKCL